MHPSVARGCLLIRREAPGVWALSERDQTPLLWAAGAHDQQLLERTRQLILGKASPRSGIGVRYALERRIEAVSWALSSELAPVTAETAEQLLNLCGQDRSQLYRRVTGQERFLEPDDHLRWQMVRLGLREDLERVWPSAWVLMASSSSGWLRPWSQVEAMLGQGRTVLDSSQGTMWLPQRANQPWKLEMDADKLRVVLAYNGRNWSALMAIPRKNDQHSRLRVRLDALTYVSFTSLEQCVDWVVDQHAQRSPRRMSDQPRAWQVENLGALYQKLRLQDIRPTIKWYLPDEGLSDDSGRLLYEQRDWLELRAAQLGIDHRQLPDSDELRLAIAETAQQTDPLPPDHVAAFTESASGEPTSQLLDLESLYCYRLPSGLAHTALPPRGGRLRSSFMPLRAYRPLNPFVG